MKEDNIPSERRRKIQQAHSTLRIRKQSGRTRSRTRKIDYEIFFCCCYSCRCSAYKTMARRVFKTWKHQITHCINKNSNNSTPKRHYYQCCSSSLLLKKIRWLVFFSLWFGLLFLVSFVVTISIDCSNWFSRVFASALKPLIFFLLEIFLSCIHTRASFYFYGNFSHLKLIFFS